MLQKRPMERLILTLRRQTTKALASLQKKIAQREKELEELKAEAARWESALGKEAKAASSLPSRRSQAAKRLDWNAILKGLPATFTAKDLAQRAGKPVNRAYAPLSRWLKAKKVRKRKDGYQKVSGAG
jgi:hypothetical protein